MSFPVVGVSGAESLKYSAKITGLAAMNFQYTTVLWVISHWRAGRLTR